MSWGSPGKGQTYRTGGSAPASRRPFRGRWTNPGAPAVTFGARPLPSRPGSSRQMGSVPRWRWIHFHQLIFCWWIHLHGLFFAARGSVSSASFISRLFFKGGCSIPPSEVTRNKMYLLTRDSIRQLPLAGSAEGLRLRAVGWPWQRFRVPRAGPNMAAGSWGLRPFLGGSGKNVARGSVGAGGSQAPCSCLGRSRPGAYKQQRRSKAY